MSAAWWIARRELASAFFSPVAYAVFGLFALGSGLVFLIGFEPDRVATMRDTFVGVVWLLGFVVPALSMRSIADERARNTIEKLRSLPVSAASIVVGKWLGVWALVAVMLLPLVAQALVLEAVASPDWGPILTGLGGLLLVGGLYAAIGVACSAWTDSQVVAFLAAVLVVSVLSFGLYFLPESSWVGPQLGAVFRAGNVNQQFGDFARGLVDVRNFVFFATLTAWWLLVATATLRR